MLELALFDLTVDSKLLRAATWSPSGSMTSPPTAMQSNGHPCARRDRTTDTRALIAFPRVSSSLAAENVRQSGPPLREN